MSYNIIILAAGGSSRLGRPKQLLEYNEASLLQHAITEAIQTSAEKVIVVLGANSQVILEKMGTQFDKEKENKKLVDVLNEEWQEGIASSIRVGVESAVSMSPGIEGLVIMVCDQPFVTASLISQLEETHHRTGKPIVACHYTDTVGTPVYFSQAYFDELLKLTGDTGAKKIILKHTGDTSLVEFEDGGVDIDTEKDVELLNSPPQRQPF